MQAYHIEEKRRLAPNQYHEFSYLDASRNGVGGKDAVVKEAGEWGGGGASRVPEEREYWISW